MMFGLSRKDIINYPTNLIKIDNLTVFMSAPNRVYLTKQIYNLHKANNGLKCYLHFKEVVPDKMKEWLYDKKYLTFKVLNSMDIIEFMNKQFIKDHENLYIGELMESNVYRSKLTILHDDMVMVKKPDELLAEDIRNIDVWAPQTTEAASASFRYKNTIPFWQKSMNTRHYDRSNQGLAHADPDRASLTPPASGRYTGELQKIIKAKTLRYDLKGAFPHDIM